MAGWISNLRVWGVYTMSDEFGSTYLYLVQGNTEYRWRQVKGGWADAGGHSMAGIVAIAVAAQYNNSNVQCYIADDGTVEGIASF